MIYRLMSNWTGIGKRLESAFRKALYDYKLLDGVTTVGVALSGGKDSLTLLHLLKAVSGRGFQEFDIHAIYVSGDFSCGPSVTEDFLRGICDTMGVSFEVCESKQKRENLECYSCSRERRRLIFEAAKRRGIDRVAFGHHRDDSIQTLLLNLLQRGEFAANLAEVPMHRYGITIIRPLIYIAEKDIKTFAKIHGFARIVCQCPVGQHSKRKEIDELLCDLEGRFPSIRENLAHASLNYGSEKAKRI